MKKSQKTLRKKRICIVIVWLVSVLAVSCSLFLLERSNYCEKGRADLLEQGEILANQIPSLIENDFYSRAGYLRLQFDKLKGLAFALEFYEDAEQARALLDDFVRNADVEALAMFDRDCNMLYSSDPDLDLKEEINVELFDQLLKEKYFEQIDRQLIYSDEYQTTVFSDGLGDTHDYQLGWFVQDRWLLVMKGVKSDLRYEIERYFNWADVLQRIQISSGGCLLAIDQTGGKVLSFGAKEAQGEPMESLDICLDGKKKALTLEELLSLFEDSDRIVKLRVAGREYYASRVPVENVLMLALAPLDEISSSALHTTIPLASLLVTISVLAMIFIFLHLSEEKGKHGNKPNSNLRSLPGKLWVCMILVLTVSLPLNFYLQALILYADTYNYCRSRLDTMISLLDNNTEASETLKALSDEEYLVRCHGAKTILDHAEEKDVDRSYLNSLCDAISLHYIYYLDEYGKAALTNSPYDRWRLDKDSPFRKLLNGEPWICGKMEKDEASGEYRQLIGASRKDADGLTCGAILFSVLPTERSAITDNLGMSSVFDQICLRDDTSVMIINAQDMTVGYLTNYMDGKYETVLSKMDDEDISISTLNIDEKRITDNYNGDMRFKDEKYFVSVRLWNDTYYALLWPQVSIKGSYLAPLILNIATAVILLLILFFIACCGLTAEEVNPEAAYGNKEAGLSSKTEDAAGAGISSQTAPKNKWLQWIERLRKYKEHLMAALMDQKNGQFEERWPEDGIKWADKTLKQKFSLCSKVVLVVFFCITVLHAVLADKKTIWYYCVNGDWDNGINIYSLTTCVIGICVMVMIKLLCHRLLYLTARVTDARGETICHLIDNSLGYILFIIGVFFCLSTIGVSLATLSLTGGVAGVIFGIGCQNIVADILAGIIMVFEGVVCAGDFVSYNGQFGSVLSIGVRTTQIKYYGDLMIVRNNDFKNYIKMGANVKSRINVDLWIDLHESLERVESIFNREQQQIHDEVCEFAWDKEIDGPTYRGIKKISENGYAMNFVLLVKGMNYGWALRGLNRSLRFMCERNNIQIAMPQIVVNEPLQKQDEDH